MVERDGVRIFQGEIYKTKINIKQKKEEPQDYKKET